MNNGPLFADLYVRTWQAEGEAHARRHARRRRHPLRALVRSLRAAARRARAAEVSAPSLDTRPSGSRVRRPA
jgi:hypothetical protein